MLSGQSSPSIETQTVTMEALMATIDPFLKSITPKEWLKLANGNPEPSTACALQKTLEDILELFSCMVLHSVHKENCTMKDLKVAVGNKVPEAFAKVLETNEDISTENTRNLNRLIVQYLLAKVNHSLDSGTRDRVEQAPCMAMIGQMVDETSLIMKDLSDKLRASGQDFTKPADGESCEPKSKINGLMGKIKRFFRNVTGKYSSKVAPLIVQEQPETSFPESQSTKDLQVLEWKPKLDEISPVVAFCQPEILLTENLLESESEPESSSDDSSDGSSSAFTPGKEDLWDSRISVSSVLDYEGNEGITESQVCSGEEQVSHPVPNLKPSSEICDGMISAELQQEKPELESISEPKDVESEEIKMRKKAMRSLVRDVIQRLIYKSGQRYYPEEVYNDICDRLSEKLWSETRPRVFNMSPDKIRRQGQAIFKNLLKECKKAENILLLLEAGAPIMERNILTTMENQVQPRWKTFSSIKKAFKEAVQNLRENQHRLYLWL